MTAPDPILQTLREIRADQLAHFRRVEQILERQEQQLARIELASGSAWELLAVLGQVLLFSRTQINRAFGLGKNTLANWNVRSYSETGSTMVSVKLEDLTNKLKEKRK
jgi:hypothetical protein